MGFQEENQKLIAVTHSLNLTLQSFRRLHRKSNGNGNGHAKITDYFGSNHTKFQPQQQPIKAKPNKIIIRSKCIKSFVNNEGKGIFKLKFDHEQLHHIFYCEPCHKYHTKFGSKRTRYDHGIVFTDLQILDEILFYEVKKNIIQHMNKTTMHTKCMEEAINDESIDKRNPIMIKIETVYHMLLKSSPLHDFEDCMGLFYRISKHLSVVSGENVIDIGDICHSKREALKIVKCFMTVLQRKLFYILQVPASQKCNFRLAFYGYSMDSWSKGKYFFIFIHSVCQPKRNRFTLILCVLYNRNNKC